MSWPQTLIRFNMCLKSRASLVNPELLQARPSSLVLRRRTTCLCSMAARRTLAAGRGHGRGAPNAAAAAAPAAADDDDDDDDDEDDDDEEDGESFRAWPALHPRRLALRTIAVAEPCVGPYVGSGTAAATRTPLECPRLQDASIPLTIPQSFRTHTCAFRPCPVYLCSPRPLLLLLAVTLKHTSLYSHT